MKVSNGKFEDISNDDDIPLPGSNVVVDLGKIKNTLHYIVDSKTTARKYGPRTL